MTNKCKTKFTNNDRTSVEVQSFSVFPPTIQETDDMPIERRDVFIPGFMEINSEQNLNCIAFSIL